jgi:23S rRNA (cytidine1920-2'-O)/16S rRNA (cytidine1409-2'-O)-methyltransferase
MIAARAESECEIHHLRGAGGSGPASRTVRGVKRVRVDSLLSERGIFESRARAAASVLAGDVRVGPDRHRASKPGQLVPENIELEVTAVPPFVSRGGLKLAHAIDALSLAVEDRLALDVGASTGGFTDCLLQRGARHVIVVDVAYGELHWRLRTDPRVTPIERRNARSISPGDLAYPPDLIAIDVSFISLSKVLGAVLACAADRFDCLALVKPQFEVGRGQVGKGGVVRDPALRRQALIDVAGAARELGAAVMGFASSGLPGPKGNLETFIWLGEGARGGIADVDAAAREIEP